MTNKLHEAFELAQPRTGEEQNYIAELVPRRLEDREWEALAAAAFQTTDAVPHASIHAGWEREAWNQYPT